MTFQHLVQNSTNQSYDASANQLSQSSAPQDLSRNGGMGGGPFCLLSYSVMREDIDVLSVRFQPLDGVLVLVHSDKPSVMRLRLDTGMDSGGSLTITLKSNKVLSLLLDSLSASGMGLAQGTLYTNFILVTKATV